MVPQRGKGPLPSAALGGGPAVGSEQPVPAAPELGLESDEAAYAAEQMLAATEKLRARLPMMQGEVVPAQPTRD